MATKRKTDNRYPGTDTANWTVYTTAGKLDKNKSYGSFTEANTEARRYTEATGEYAAAARA